MALAAVSRSSFLGNGIVADTSSSSFRATTSRPGQIVMTSNFEKNNPYADELKRTAAFISQPGKGILASDESNATTGKRLVQFPQNRLTASLFEILIDELWRIGGE